MQFTKRFSWLKILDISAYYSKISSLKFQQFSHCFSYYCYNFDNFFVITLYIIYIHVCISVCMQQYMIE